MVLSAQSCKCEEIEEDFEVWCRTNMHRKCLSVAFLSSPSPSPPPRRCKCFLGKLLPCSLHSVSCSYWRKSKFSQFMLNGVSSGSWWCPVLMMNWTACRLRVGLCGQAMLLGGRSRLGWTLSCVTLPDLSVNGEYQLKAMRPAPGPVTWCLN